MTPPPRSASIPPVLIKPPRLHPGDTIAIIAPASAPPDPKAVDRSVETIERLGFKPKLAPNVRKRWGFLAGSDRDRASDLMRMFADPKVNALLCIRGGYGTPRLLPLLDYTVIRKNPKVFIGFSDITALHCAFLFKSNLLSFHGPMLNSDLNKPHCPPFTISSLLKTTMRSVPAHSINAGHPLLQKSSPRASNLKHLPKPQILKKGIASGPLIGGNISLLCGLVGTPYLPPLKGAILFLEDLDEPPYRFDRMLTHLLTAGVFQQIAGIAIGINYNCEDPKAKTFKEYRQTLVDVLKERLLPLKIPMVMNLPFGHIPLNATLPIGANVTLDADNADLIINESAVR